MRIAWHNTQYPEEADFIVLGCASEEGSSWEGTSKAPEAIRKASREWLTGELHDGTNFRYNPQSSALNKLVFDDGNVKKSVLAEAVQTISSDKKIPVILGGDHSVTTEALKGFDETTKNISLVYIDSHPDFMESEMNYYASVLTDVQELKNVKLNKSVLVGVRGANSFELENIKKSKMKTFYSVDFVESGVKKIFNQIKKKITKKFYLSIDVDVLDPAFAPGVSDPVPGGITSNELTLLCKKLASLKPIGFDIVEVLPDNDVNEKTSTFAAKLVSEIISSYR